MISNYWYIYNMVEIRYFYFQTRIILNSRLDSLQTTEFSNLGLKQVIGTLLRLALFYLIKNYSFQNIFHCSGY